MNVDPNAVDAASEADRRFFEANPSRTCRVRAAREGELPGLRTPERGWAYIAVRQIEPGVRARLSFWVPEPIVDSEELAQRVIAAILGGAA